MENNLYRGFHDHYMYKGVSRRNASTICNASAVFHSVTIHPDLKNMSTCLLLFAVRFLVGVLNSLGVVFRFRSLGSTDSGFRVGEVLKMVLELHANVLRAIWKRAQGAKPHRVCLFRIGLSIGHMLFQSCLLKEPVQFSYS